MDQKGIEVPSYDGTPEGLAAYKEAVLQYLMATETHKRYLVGPRLVQRLTGVAKALIRTQTLRDPQWLAHPRSAYTLLGFLEETLERPSLIEANKHVMAFFYQLERKKGETMTEWIARHSERLWEASRALQRVQREHGRLDVPSEKEWKDSRSSYSRTSERNTGDQEVPFRDDGRLEETEDEQTNDDSEQHTWRWNKSSWSWSESGGDWSWKSPEYEPPKTWSFDEKPFIPEFLAGFLLLHRSGLEPSERSNILASIKGQFTTQAVARALREQWSDTDVAKRDKAKASAAYLLEEDDEDALYNNVDEHEFSQWDTEQQDAYLAEQQTIDEALEAIKFQKSTLKEARWRQRQIKLGRNFYPPKPYKGGKGDGRPSKGDIKCFRCGGPHYQDKCPQRFKEKSAQIADEESAEIAFTASEFAGQADYMEPNTNNNLEKFQYGIIDSGATASLGSVDALEELMIANIHACGDSKMQVNTSKRPTFKFGNGMRKECLSTINLSIGAGEKRGNMEIHVHDSPGQPVLISRKALAALGAVVDFSENKVIYKAVNPSVVLQLKQAENGHLLMPLTGNLLDGGHKRDKPFSSLDE